MRLNHLVVRDFRNVREADLHLTPGINVLWGANAQGKTNLLEAIHTLVTGRSFRARRERECIRRGGGEAVPEDRVAFVRGDVTRRDGIHTLQIALQGLRRRVEIDGAPISKLASLWGQLNAVLFTPDDLQIIKGPPVNRRQFLDMEISQVRPSYLAWLQRFQVALSERTALVRAIGGGERHRCEEIDAWDAALAEAAAEIHGHRRDVIRRLGEHATETHRAVSGGEETLTLLHRSFLAVQEPLTREECIELHRELLLEARGSDIERGQTSV
ncbi:DNA replication and repair protein RecF, partial [Candidatus Sumerlaeota bacterium]|nr:DNA replication and repair protein RecF [Candidatus Sumerlaeota bacterium]